MLWLSSNHTYMAVSLLTIYFYYYFTTQHTTANFVVIQNLLSNRKLYVELNNEHSRWRKQKNGLPQGSVLASTIFNIYTTDQPIHDGTRSFIYANDLCITAQYQSFKQVEETIEEPLDNMTIYHKMNSLRANLKNTSHCVPSRFSAHRQKSTAPSGHSQQLPPATARWLSYHLRGIQANTGVPQGSKLLLSIHSHDPC